MKFLVVLSALLAVASAGSFSKEYQRIKKWSKQKALEHCYGSDIMNQWMIKSKKAMRKCSGMPAPELDLPMFKSPVRMIQALMMNAKDMHRTKLMDFMEMMTKKEEKQQPQQTVAFVPYPMQSQQQSHQGHHGGMEHHFMMKMLKKMMFKKMMKKMLKSEMMGFDDEEDDDDDDEPQRLVRGNDDEDLEDSFDKFLEVLLKSTSQASQALRRSKRATDADLLDIGDKLVEKLKMEQEKMKMKWGNYSCMLQEIGMIDADMNIDLASNLKYCDEMDIKDPWLKEKSKKAVRLCYAAVESLPREVLNECTDEKWFKIKKYMHCLEMKKYKMCMGYDVKKKLEEEFGDLDKLINDTGMDEHTLLMLTNKMLNDDHMH